MFIETLGQRIRLVRPRSFAGLMTLYESNHVRLRQLLGSLWNLPSKLASISSTDLSIHLSVDGCSRYTTSLRMTYLLNHDGIATPDPDLLIRVYHDARLAEAVSCCDRPRNYIFRRLNSPVNSELEQRWLLNIFLNKWLEHCLDHQHNFN
jgi:uncharacterized protein